jgi:hypothetical protein
LEEEMKMIPEAAAHPASVDMDFELLHQRLLFVLAIGNAVIAIEGLNA